MPFYFHSALCHAMHEHPAHCHWRGVAMFLTEDPRIFFKKKEEVVEE